MLIIQLLQVFNILHWPKKTSGKCLAKQHFNVQKIGQIQKVQTDCVITTDIFHSMGPVSNSIVLQFQSPPSTFVSSFGLFITSSVKTANCLYTKNKALSREAPFQILSMFGLRYSFKHIVQIILGVSFHCTMKQLLRITVVS